MAIKGNVGTGVISILAADTTLLDPDAGDRERAAVSAAYLYNTSASTVTVGIFVSPDLTSASGKKIDNYVMAASSTMDISAIIGQGFSATQNIIAVGSGTGVNALLTIVEYTESS